MTPQCRFRIRPEPQRRGKAKGIIITMIPFACGEYESRTRDLLHAMRILLFFIAFHSFSFRFQRRLSGNFLFHIFA